MYGKKILSHDSNYLATQTDLDFQHTVDHASRAKIFIELYWNLELDKLECVQGSHLSENIWYCVSTTTQDEEIPDFLDVIGYIYPTAIKSRGRRKQKRF